jgi:hypothetical protein
VQIHLPDARNLNFNAGICAKLPLPLAAADQKARSGLRGSEEDLERAVAISSQLSVC